MATNLLYSSGRKLVDMRYRAKLAALAAFGLAGLIMSRAEPPTKLTPRELFYATPAPLPAAKAPPAAKSAKRNRTPKPAAGAVAAQTPEPSMAVAAGPLGLRYSIVKYGPDGAAREVDSATTFHSGDRIRLRVRVNDSGYLYIAHRGSSGAWQILFPNKELDGGLNQVSAGREYDVPGTTRLVFDDTPGEERIFIVLARRPELQLDRLIYDLDGGVQPSEHQRRKVLLAEARIPDSSIGSLRMTARDLVFEKVDSSRPAPVQAGGKPETAVYVVNAGGASDARVVAELTLKHL